MSTVEKLRGGVDNDNGNSNASALQKARKALAARGKEISLDFLRKKPVAREDDGRASREALATYVKDIADGAYDFVLNTARPFLRRLECEVQEIGPEVLVDRCDVSDQTNKELQEEYEGTILRLQLFVPEDDGVLREEVSNPGREEFVKSLSLRIRQSTQIALLVDDIRHAGNKPKLESIVWQDARETIDDDASKVFINANPQNPKARRLFGKHYDLADGVFGRYHEFAREKLAEAIADRSRELATAHAEQLRKQKQEISATSSDTVSPEELLFGDPDKVNDKTAVFSWRFQNKENAIRLKRRGENLYVVSALGQASKALEDAQKEFSEDEPFIRLSHVLSRDKRSLCLGHQNGMYDFSGYVTALPLTRWVRTAAGYCLRNRLLPNDAQQDNGPDANNGANKKRPVKGPGELLTDKEFVFHGGVGEYDLVFKPGFHYEPRGENNEPTGQKFEIKKQATARIERKLVEGKKTTIALKVISSPELVDLLAAGGAIEGCEFFEGAKGAGLPIPIQLGISQVFKRLKTSNA